jgi:hypothetical protein
MIRDDASLATIRALTGEIAGQVPAELPRRRSTRGSRLRVATMPPTKEMERKVAIRV